MVRFVLRTALRRPWLAPYCIGWQLSGGDGTQPPTDVAMFLRILSAVRGEGSGDSPHSPMLSDLADVLG
jgi:hypothetical protein